MRDAQSIIKRPLLTEKSSRLRETGGASAAPAEGESYAQKVEVARAVESLFKVSVTSVRTLVVRGKEKRVGRFAGRRPSWKKAFVTLKPGDNIEFFEGV